MGMRFVSGGGGGEGGLETRQKGALLPTPPVGPDVFGSPVSLDLSVSLDRSSPPSPSPVAS